MKTLIQIIGVLALSLVSTVCFAQVSTQGGRGGTQPTPLTTHTVQSNAPSLDNLQVIEVHQAPATGTELRSTTAPDLFSTGQTAPSSPGTGPGHTRKTNAGVLPGTPQNITPDPQNPQPDR